MRGFLVTSLQNGVRSKLRDFCLRLRSPVTQPIVFANIGASVLSSSPAQSLCTLDLGSIIQCNERHDCTMLAHRIDQENVVHGQQTAAAAKSLNGAKTPATKAPKTPFKGGLNDENAAGRAGKSIWKTKGKGQQLDKSAFVTPAGRLVLSYQKNAAAAHHSTHQVPRIAHPWASKQPTPKPPGFKHLPHPQSDPVR